MNKTYYIFRHGKAIDPNETYGDRIVSAELLPEGRAVTAKLAEYLKEVDESDNFSSEFLRCRQTAEIVEETTGKEFKFDKRLNEFSIDENVRNNPAFADFATETFDSLKKRVKDFVDECESGSAQNIVVCTHGIIVAAIKHFVLDGKFDVEDEFDYTETGELLIIKGNSTKIIDFN